MLKDVAGMLNHEVRINLYLVKLYGPGYAFECYHKMSVLFLFKLLE